mmetsp:Transcript_37524/g.60798  ORF Transcript_37524/g.60798 Transcript_37524/m.60798 type:complete len:306 (+) Transcript_37524:398-1315(+)
MQYETHFKAYRRFCMRLMLPFQLGRSLLRFLIWRVMTGKPDGSPLSFDTIKVQKSAIITSLQKVGFPAPDIDWGFKRFMMGAEKALYRPRAAKRPISPADLYAISGKLSKSADGMYELQEHRDLLLCMMGVAGFFRGSELVILKIEDCVVVQRGQRLWLRVFLHHSKGDQKRAGAVVYLPDGSPGCPVSLIKLFQSYVKRLGRTSGWLFSGFVLKEVREQLLPRPISRNTVSFITKRMVRLLGWPEKDVASHSLRRGGATAAARSGVPERIITRHGRWSDKSLTVRRYIDEFEDALAHLSLQLGF